MTDEAGDNADRLEIARRLCEPQGLCDEAAAEINRLRAENRRLTITADQRNKLIAGCEKEIEKLFAENQRLRELLQRWVQHDENGVIGDPEHLSLLEATGEVLDTESEVRDV